MKHFVFVRLCLAVAVWGLPLNLVAQPQAESQKSDTESWIQSEVKRLRQESDINIVMSFPDSVQWNPLFGYTSSEAQLHIALFEGLLSYNPADMRPAPGLAESWRRSSDGLRYTFSLRRDARFSNGVPIDAKTIADSWFFLIRPGSEAPFRSFLDIIAGVKEYGEGKIPQEATGIQVRGPYELELTLQDPSPELLAVLTHYSLSPVPESMRKERDWAAFYRSLYRVEGGWPPAAALVSNGPYYLAYASAAGVQLKRNPYYWNAEGVASRKVFVQRYYEWQDEDIRKGIDSYQIDWVASGFSDFLQLRRKDELLAVGQSFSTTLFYFAGSDEAANSWSDARVRKALALLLPLEKLRSGLGGTAQLVPAMPNFEPGKGLEAQDQAEAMRLLEAAGYPEGEGLGPLVLRLPQESSFYEGFAQMIREAWAELKTQVKVQYEDTEVFLKPAEASFTLGLLSWAGDYPDPTSFLNLWRSDSSLNVSGYRDPNYDTLLDQAQQTEEYRKRFELLSEAEEYLLQGGSVVPLWHTPSVNLYNQRFLDGFYQNVLDLHPLQTLRRIYRLPKGSA